MLWSESLLLTSSQRSKAALNICHSDSDFKVRILGKGEDVLLYCFSDWSFIESVGDFPFDLYTDLTDVCNWLIGGRYDHRKGLFNEGVPVNWKAYFLKRVDCGYLEMEAWIFRDDFCESHDKSVNPSSAIGLCQILYSLNCDCSYGGDSVFQEVKEQWLKEFHKEIAILNQFECTWSLTASSVILRMSSRRTLHLLSSELALKEGYSELIESAPITSTNFTPASIPPLRTYWLSSFISYLISGRTFW